MVQKILVSGASGFIAAHVVERLLAKGYDVVGTVRNANDKAKLNFLTVMPNTKKYLTLVSAHLTGPDPFSAYADVDAIIHMASPYVMNVKDPQQDLVDPAVMGTVSMLKAAAKSPRVKRVVITSSMAAITDEPDGRVLTEADWNTKSSLSRNPYYYSKTMAERAAWDFMKSVKPSFDLVVINPFVVIGPAHTSAINTSNQTFVDMMTGKYPAIMALDWGFVDVRDVANAHIAAVEKPKAAGRYICAAENLTMVETVELIRKYGYSQKKLPKLSMTGAFGTALMKLMSYSQPSGIGTYMRSHLGRHPRFDNSKIRNDLGIVFKPPSESIKDTLADLSKWGQIPKPQM